MKDQLNFGKLNLFPNFQRDTKQTISSPPLAEFSYVEQILRHCRLRQSFRVPPTSPLFAHSRLHSRFLRCILSQRTIDYRECDFIVAFGVINVREEVNSARHCADASRLIKGVAPPEGYWTALVCHVIHHFFRVMLSAMQRYILNSLATFISQHSSRGDKGARTHSGWKHQHSWLIFNRVNPLSAYTCGIGTQIVVVLVVKDMSSSYPLF